MTDNQKVKVLLAMLAEAHEAIISELRAAADNDHPVLKSKAKMLDRHDRLLAKLRGNAK